MACCVLTAYVMNRIIKACEVLDLNIIKIQYNEFDDGPNYSKGDVEVGEEARLIATKLSIDGMTCAACTAAIEAIVAKLPGVERIAVSLAMSKATVIHNPAVTPVSEIVSAVKSVGYGAKVGERTAQQNLEVAQHAKELQKLKSAFSNAATMASMILTVDWLLKLSCLSRYHHTFRLLAAGLGTWVQLVEASWIHQRAWGQGLRSPLIMDTLISLSLVCGLALSCFNIRLHGIRTGNQYFSSGAFLTLVVIGGRYLDTLFKRQTNSTLADLHKLQSQMTMVQLRKSQKDDQSRPIQQRIPAILLQQRDEILIDPGSIVPCDCYVVEGSSVVDQSTMTGESMPMAKRAGDLLMSGTQNLSNQVTAIVAREQGESSLEKLLSILSASTEHSMQEGEGGAQTLSSHFVTIVLVLALLGFCWTYTRCGDDLSVSTKLNLGCERAMAILASACPCALGLATPSAVMTGLSAAWTRGAILTGGLGTLQRMASLTHVVMDKTGTLTTGQLMVAKASWNLNVDTLMLLCAAEREDALTHPVAKAIFQWALSQLTDAQRMEQNIIEVQKLISEPGKGVSCRARLPSKDEWKSVHIGTSSFLQEQSIPISTDLRSCEKGQRTSNFVQVAIDGTHISTLFLQDTIRPEAPSVIESLRSSGLDLTLLTGDNAHEAKRVSSSLNIPILASRTLPHEKRTLVEQLQSQSPSNVVAMLGDGINDTPAMAAADVGIFLSAGLLSHPPSAPASPTLLQRSSADVILTSPTLTLLPGLLLIAQKTVRQARLNTRWAIAYNIIAVALAMGVGESWGVKVDAAMAGTMMALSSCVVMMGCLMLRLELRKINFTGKVEDDTEERVAETFRGMGNLEHLRANM